MVCRRPPLKCPFISEPFPDPHMKWQLPPKSQPPPLHPQHVFTIRDVAKFTLLCLWPPCPMRRYVLNARVKRCISRRAEVHKPGGGTSLRAPGTQNPRFTHSRENPYIIAREDRRQVSKGKKERSVWAQWCKSFHHEIQGLPSGCGFAAGQDSKFSRRLRTSSL